ncbi:MAG: serine/threonine-protein kinase [Candidatus Sericytochromatia bacterium]
MLQLGTLIDKRYEILGPLGQGGMGAVYRVRHVHLGQDFALKELLNASPEAEAQFLQEAQLLASLQHPHLPRVTDFFSAKGRNYLVMDHVPGEDLQALLDRRQAPFDPAEVTAWLRQLLEALAYVHARHVVHRDIKPANLKLTPEGKLVLVDFGIAKGGQPGPARTAYHARSAYTPYLAAPEQVMGQGTGPRTDLYAVAATATYLLTGALPPQPGSVPGPLGAVLARGMAQDPAGRWPDAGAFAQAIGPTGTAAAVPLTGRRDIRR